MYEIEFYEKENGESDVWNFLEELREKSNSSKDSRIQYKQLMLHIQLLQNNGTRLPNNITKHIEEDIWELRPGNNRVFYFTAVMTLLYCCIISERKRKKRQSVRLKKQSLSEMIIYSEGK